MAAKIPCTPAKPVGTIHSTSHVFWSCDQHWTHGTSVVTVTLADQAQLHNADDRLSTMSVTIRIIRVKIFIIDN